MPKLTATHLIKFLIYRPVDGQFTNYIKSPTGFLVEVPSNVPKVFEKNKNISGIFFTGDKHKDQYLWPLMCPDGTFEQFITDIELGEKLFLILAPEETVDFLQTQFRRQKIFIFPYECNNEDKTTCICRCFIGENNELNIVRENEIVSMN